MSDFNTKLSSLLAQLDQNQRDYNSGRIGYEKYSSGLRELESSTDPEVFRMVKDINTLRKSQLLNALEFDVDRYKGDPVSKKGLESLSERLNIPLGFEGRPISTDNGQAMGYAAPNGMVYMSGKALNSEQPVGEYLRHEGMHTQLDMPNEEAYVRQVDQLYRQGKVTPEMISRLNAR